MNDSDLELSKKGATRKLSWNVTCEGSEYWCGVEVTCDDGRSWRRLTELKRLQSFSYDISKIGGGEKCRFRDFVTDGLNTAYQETSSFSLPIPPPGIVPMNFDPKTKFAAGNTYQLKAQLVYALGMPH